MLSRLGPTPSQTIGPFFHYALPWKGGADLLSGSSLGWRADLVPDGHDFLHATTKDECVQGEPIEIIGTIRDGSGSVVDDALVEILQLIEAPAKDSNRQGGLFGRSASDAQGGFRFLTVRPHAIAKANAVLAPHIMFTVFGRGILKPLFTRMYFPDSRDNDRDAVLAMVPAERRQLLVAENISPPSAIYRFDITLQGPKETPFFRM